MYLYFKNCSLNLHFLNLETMYRQKIEVEPNLDEKNVLEHLNHINGVFNDVKDLTSADLYAYLSNIERDYMHRQVNNFATTVHQLNPRAYMEDELKLSFVRIRRCNDRALSDRMNCPYCRKKLTPLNAYNVHIKKVTVTCETCKEPITCEALALAIFVENFNRGDYPIKAFFDESTKLVINTQNSSWKSFSSYLLQVLRVSRKVLTLPQPLQRLRAIFIRKQMRDLVSPLRSNMSCLSLDLIKGMYRQLSFVNKICHNYHHWCDPVVLQSSIARYFKFIHLIASHPGKTFVPTMDIDLVWHAHQTNPTSYGTYTKSVLGKVLNHDDTIGSEDLGKGRDLHTMYIHTCIHTYTNTYTYIH